MARCDRTTHDRCNIRADAWWSGSRAGDIDHGAVLGTFTSSIFSCIQFPVPGGRLASSCRAERLKILTCRCLADPRPNHRFMLGVKVGELVPGHDDLCQRLPPMFRKRFWIIEHGLWHILHNLAKLLPLLAISFGGSAKDHRWPRKIPAATPTRSARDDDRRGDGCRHAGAARR